MLVFTAIMGFKNLRLTPLETYRCNFEPVADRFTGEYATRFDISICVRLGIAEKFCNHRFRNLRAEKKSNGEGWVATVKSNNELRTFIWLTF